MRRLFVLSAVLFLVAPPLYSRTWHIRPDGSGDAPTIRAGIDSSAAGDTVLVGCGEYSEFSVRVKSGILLTSETGDPSCVTIDAGQRGRVMYCQSATEATTIRGFTLTRGYATGSSPDYHGGGLYLESSSARIEHCLFRENTAVWLGGGLACNNYSTPRVSDCEFIGNAALRGGGVGIHIASPQFRNCLFEENVASDCGGGIATSEGVAGSFIDCQIVGNRAGDGAGADCLRTSVGFVNCLITGNSADGEGGGLCYSYCSLGRVRAVNCMIVENKASRGGGIGMSWADVTLSGCTVERNTGFDTGGGMYLYEESSPVLETCVIQGNRAPRGGGMYVDHYCWPELRNCILYGNRGDVAGSGIYTKYQSYPQIWNTIIAFGVSGEAIKCDYQTSPVLRCSDIYGNAGGDWVGCFSDQINRDGNLCADPLFCGAPVGDFTLQSSSPCLPGHHPTGYDCGLIGILGEGCSGPTAVEHTSWGGVKRMFR